MVSLPSYLFPFLNLHIHSNASFLMKLNSIILRLVWCYESHRISRAHIPNFQKKTVWDYRLLNTTAGWLNQGLFPYWKCRGAKAEGNPLWLQLEAVAIKMSTLPTPLFSASAPADKIIQQNFILKNSLRILNQIKGTWWVPSVSMHAPIWQNHSFLCVQLDGV